MNAQEIIEYIRTSEKKTPVKVYVWEKAPVVFPGCQEFPAGEGCKIVFGDWKDVKKRWQEYTEELYKKDLHDQDNHDGVISHLEPDILECEVKWALGSITMN